MRSTPLSSQHNAVRTQHTLPNLQIVDMARMTMMMTLFGLIVGGAASCASQPQPRGLPMATLLVSPGSAQSGSVGHAHDNSGHGDDGKVRTITAEIAVEVTLPVAVDFVISEVMSDPLLLADVVGEYVEVVYLGATVARLGDARLVLPDGRSVRLDGMGQDLKKARKGRKIKEKSDVPEIRVVRPGQVLIVRSTRKRRLRLPNRAGRVELRVGGRLIDVAQWSGRWPWPKHKAGRALCRVDSTRDGGTGRAWRRCTAKLRSVERGSPGVVRSVCRWLRRRNVLTPECALAAVEERRERRRGRGRGGVQRGGARRRLVGCDR